MVTTIFEEDSLAPRLRKATTGQAGKKNIATEALKHRRENANCIFLCFRASVADKNPRRG